MRLSCLEGKEHFQVDSYSFADEFARFVAEREPGAAAIVLSQPTLIVASAMSGFQR